MKRCTFCKIEKDESEFWYNAKKSRYVAHCKQCKRERAREYNERTKEQQREVDRRWRIANKDKVAAAQKRWRDKNPGLAARRTAEWRKQNLQRALEAQRICNRKLKDAAYAAYGGYRCACCGETEEAFLSLDHVNNDGNLHRKQVDRRKIYKWLARESYPEGFQVLCMNCNFGKARNGGICPHKTRTFEGSTTIPKGSTPQAIGGGSAGLRISNSDEDIV